MPIDWNAECERRKAAKALGRGYKPTGPRAVNVVASLAGLQQKNGPSDGEERLAEHFIARGIPHQRQFRFHPVRMWTVDFYLPDVNSALEVEGGTHLMKCRKCGGNGCQSCRGIGWQPGRHTSGPGYEKDLEKYNQLQLLGFRLYRCTTRQAKSGEFADWVLTNLYHKTAPGLPVPQRNERP